MHPALRTVEDFLTWVEHQEIEGLDAGLRLDAVEVTLPLADLYEGVALAPPDAAPG